MRIRVIIEDYADDTYGVRIGLHGYGRRHMDNAGHMAIWTVF